MLTRITTTIVLAASITSICAAQDTDVADSPLAARTSRASAPAQLPPAPAFTLPGQLEALFTNLAASPTSDVPGIAGAKFQASTTSSVIFDRPWLSPNGTHWAIAADTDQSSAFDEVLLVDGAVLVQEGTPVTFDPGQNWGVIDTRVGINDAGEIAITNNLVPSSVNDDYTIHITAGPTFTVVTQQGQPIPALPGATWDDGADSPVLLNDGRISVAEEGIAGAGITSANDEILVLGNVLVAREGVTVPGNQAGGATEAWDSFSLEDIWVSTSGSVLILGDLLGLVSSDQVLVLNGNVVLQEGHVIPGSGFVSPILGTGIRYPMMAGNGDWIVRGENADQIDWVVRNGAVVATTGSPIASMTKQTLMTAVIDGAQETPPSGSAATGTGLFLVDPGTNTLYYEITLSGVVNETMAHIHGFAPPGTPAGILYALPLGNTKTGLINYVEAEEAGILAGQTYVNIHTGAFPGGEIRGQIVAGTEVWRDLPSPLPLDTFFAVAANQSGDFVIMGTSNAPQAANGVLVLNNTHIIARENDAVDLDGNGMFDDDVFLSAFGTDDVALADDGTVYFTATVRNAAGAQIGQGFFRRAADSMPVAYCFGDGSGTMCPCGNASAPGAMSGCLSSLGLGGRLTASGTASIAADTVVLAGSQMPDSSVLYFQGTTQVAGGAGAVFGDGLRCVAGSVVRLKTLTNVGGASQYPDAGSPSVSVRGMIATPGVRNYQAWYRNAAAFCTPATFNLTNAVEITWGA